MLEQKWKSNIPLLNTEGQDFDIEAWEKTSEGFQAVKTKTQKKYKDKILKGFIDNEKALYAPKGTQKYNPRESMRGKHAMSIVLHA